MALSSVLLIRFCTITKHCTGGKGTNKMMMYILMLNDICYLEQTISTCNTADWIIMFVIVYFL